MFRRKVTFLGCFTALKLTKVFSDVEEETRETVKTLFYENHMFL